MQQLSNRRVSIAIADVIDTEEGYEIVRPKLTAFAESHTETPAVMAALGFRPMENSPSPVNLVSYLRQVSPSYFVNDEGQIKVIFDTWEQLKACEESSFRSFLQLVNSAQ